MNKKLKSFRFKIDEIDSKIINSICKRATLVKKIKKYKEQKKIPFLDRNREKEIYQRAKKLTKEKGLNEDFIKRIFKRIIGQTGNLSNDRS